MTLPQHTRREVLEAACGRTRDLWPALVVRMKDLTKANPDEAKRLDTFGKVIGSKLDNVAQIEKVLDGEWMVLLSKVLNAVVSPETKRERLNCATCDPSDFPVMLAVIQAVAYGAPERMWTPSAGAYVGKVDSDEQYNRGKQGEPTPESHHEIAARTWYRPQLVMLVTSIWPKNLGLEYYESTLRHILHPGVNVDTEWRDRMERLSTESDVLDGLI